MIAAKANFIPRAEVFAIFAKALYPEAYLVSLNTLGRIVAEAEKERERRQECESRKENYLMYVLVIQSLVSLAIPRAVGDADCTVVLWSMPSGTGSTWQIVSSLTTLTFHKSQGSF